MLTLYPYLITVTCSDSDRLADQAGAGAMTSHHCDVVVLPTSQIEEFAVSVCAVALSLVAETAASIDSVGCGPVCSVPCNCGDVSLAVHLC